MIKLTVFIGLVCSSVAFAASQIDLSPGTAATIKVNQPTLVSCGTVVKKLPCSIKNTTPPTIADPTNYCMQVNVEKRNYGEYCSLDSDTATRLAKERIAELRADGVCN